MQEGWVEFRRIDCKEGFVDHFISDSACNPNILKKPTYHVNTYETYFRLNGKGKWINKHFFKYGFWSVVVNEPLEHNAEMLWEDYLKENDNNE